MLKFMGILLILTASLATGVALAYQVKQRLEELIYIKKLMLMFRGELDYKNALLPEAFRAVAVRAKAPYDELFGTLAKETEENFSVSMAEVFTEAVDTVLAGKTYLKKEDLVKFKEIGDTLGYQNQKMQLSNIDLYIDRLSALIGEEREKTAETIKVYRTLAMMTGVLIAIVLV